MKLPRIPQTRGVRLGVLVHSLGFAEFFIEKDYIKVPLPGSCRFAEFFIRKACSKPLRARMLQIRRVLYQDASSQDLADPPTFYEEGLH